MQYSPQNVCDINLIATFLARGGSNPRPAENDFDHLILLGNSVLHTAEEAFLLVKSGIVGSFLISGGIGHATSYLYQSIQSHPKYGVVATDQRSEADLLREIAISFWQIAPETILIENLSTNCGENATESKRVFDGQGIGSGKILLIQDPTMQRRSDATFELVWRERPEFSFQSWATFVPRVALCCGDLQFTNPGVAGIWDRDRFLSLILGEIPRLRNDNNGYGPRGRGFIAAVEIPAEIQEAYERLRPLSSDPSRCRAIQNK